MTKNKESNIYRNIKLGEIVKGNYPVGEFCEAMQITKPTYYKYIHGKFSIPSTKLIKMAILLGVTPNDILGFKKPKELRIK